MNPSLLLRALPLWLALVLTLPAQKLEVGSPAPALEIEKWLKGDPVDLAKAPKDQVTVIEFWASW
jgi:hypothetical protein